MNRYFVSANFLQLYNQLEEQRQQLGICENFELLYFNYAKATFQEHPCETDIVMVHDKLQKIPISVDQSNDYLLYHDQTNGEVLKQFLPRNIRSGHHTDGKSAPYGIFFGSIRNKPKDAANTIFKKIFEIDLSLESLLSYFKFLDPREKLAGEGIKKLAELDAHVKAKYSEMPTKE